MRIVINDKEVIIPSSLSEITLGQRIDFYEQYGRELDEMAKSILDMEDGPLKDIEITEFNVEKMFRTFAFFAGTTVDALKESEFIDKIASIYFSSLSTLFDDEQDIKLEQSFVWKEQEWELHAPELKNDSRMTFGEFIDAKQVVKDLMELQAGKWQQLISLAAIYFRKKGEAYQESFLWPGSERLKLMRELPMNIALQVGFFLSSSLNIYINTLGFSSQAALKLAATGKNISTVGAG